MNLRISLFGCFSYQYFISDGSYLKKFLDLLLTLLIERPSSFFIMEFAKLSCFLIIQSLISIFKLMSLWILRFYSNTSSHSFKRFLLNPKITYLDFINKNINLDISGNLINFRFFLSVFSSIFNSIK
jgi:hypothetical protein